MKKSTAIVLTHGYLNTINAKTCHGLLRYSPRFEIRGVIDKDYGGQDAGEVMSGKNVGIKVYSSVSDFFDTTNESVDYLIIGVATHGGKLPDAFVPEIVLAIKHKASIINGLHDHVYRNDEIAKAAKENEVDLIDIRKPKELEELTFWHGSIYDVKAQVIAVLGVDCALGKRTTSGMIYEMCNRKGVKTEMIYTGQTGWMQGYKYGFIFDSTLNDFISGEIESSIVDCDQNENPDIILLEGQSSLRNPSGPGGSEFLVSGNAKGVILQIAPKRTYFEGYEDQGIIIPSAKDEIELINKYGSVVIAVTMYTKDMKPEAIERQKIVLEKELGLPVVAPLYEGVDDLFESIQAYRRDRALELKNRAAIS